MKKLIWLLAVMGVGPAAAEDPRWFTYINLERGAPLRMSDVGVSSHSFAESAEICNPADEFICYQLKNSDFGFSVPRRVDQNANQWVHRGKKFCVIERFLESDVIESTQLLVVTLQHRDESCQSGTLRIASQFIFSYSYGLKYINYMFGDGPNFHLIAMRASGWGAPAARSDLSGRGD